MLSVTRYGLDNQGAREMISDELGLKLHDRATRGERLAAEERAQLESWYAAQDRAEMVQLGLTEPARDLSTLQAQVDSATARVATISKQIQKLAAVNAALRREISMLRRRLAQQPVLQPS
jgi:septal ring factor EnvC (AmiA/AmiB activator)